MEDLYNKPWPEYLKPLQGTLGGRYDYAFEIAKGKTGVTHALRRKDGRSLVCLKTLRPDIVGSPERADGTDTLRKEVAILDPLNHRCFPRVFERDLATEPPYYVCTYHPGNTFLRFKQSGSTLTKEQADFVIYQLFDALEYLHENDRTHCDFHQNNILISKHIYRDGILIIDFGSGHRGSDSSPTTLDRGDFRYKDVEQQARLRQRIDRAGAMDHFRASDFRALGHLLALMRECFFGEASPEQAIAYRAFCEALEHGDISSWEEARTKYAAVTDPRILINRAERLFIDADGSRRAIQIPVTPLVAVGEPILRLINARTFQRLRFTKQLSFCEWFFPGGTHTRFEHSLGVLETTRQALARLADIPSFRDAFTSVNVEGALLAALTHDIGHYPFAHVMEHYVSSRFTDSANDKLARTIVSHSQYTLRLLETDSELRQAIHTAWGDDHLNECQKVLEGGVPVLSQLLDGPIDTDKVDYLRRDAHHCGFSYGKGLDLVRIFQSLRPVAGMSGLGISSAGVTAIEGFMVVQEQMLASLYWEEHIRGVIAMFHAFIAAFVGRDIDRLRDMTAKLKECISDEQAMQRVVLPLLDTLHEENKVRARKSLRPLKRDELEPLVRLHTQPSFKDIFVPIQRYTRSDPIPPRAKARHNIYHSILMQPTSAASLIPVEWRHVGDLRGCYLAAFREKAPHDESLSRFEVLIDVPWGKSGNREITVVDEVTGAEMPITSVSHLRDSIFLEPTAFLAPIRVYVSPRVFRQHRHHLRSVITSAEERFYGFEYEADPQDELV